MELLGGRYGHVHDYEYSPVVKLKEEKFWCGAEPRNFHIILISVEIEFEEKEKWLGHQPLRSSASGVGIPATMSSPFLTWRSIQCCDLGGHQPD